ncbi:MAG: glycosyltransferase, partial [Patescibacteria group bacterium]
MKIIQAHKFYWYRDGASNYALFLSELLRNKGHEVIPFAMQNPKNLDSAYGKFFVSGAELDDPSQVSLSKKIKYAGRMFYSCEAKHKMKALLRSESVDIVHLHNIYHHISPSILPVIKKKGIPIVMTLHDYKLICPNYTMFHHGAVHEEDCKGWYGSCVKNKCMKDNRMQSRIVCAEMIFHHKIMKYYERYVDKFIAPSRFMMGKCIEMGWGADRFISLPNPIDKEQKATNKKQVDGDYVAYVGRLSEEKGL